MSVHRDRSSGSVAAAAENAPAETAATGGQDPLSDVLRRVRLTGALFFMVDATSPWCVEVPPAGEFAEILLPRARHIVSYHIVVQGAGFAAIPGRDPIAIETGDVVVFPHADAYRMQSAPGVPPEFDSKETLRFFREMAAGNLPFVVPEGGGEDPPAQFVCGFLGCDAQPFNPLLATLPRLLRVRRGTSGDLLDRLVEITLAEAQAARAGGASVRLRLSELLFVEVIRRHLETQPANGGGWLSGLADPVVGRALTLLHRRPAEAWTLGELAREAGASRSVLTERFTRLVGCAPMQYLTRWRMQLAAGLLSDGGIRVGAVAREVGYASETAFSRSFTRIAGLPPSRWRQAPARDAE